jgi:hypothetical protein
MWGQQIDEHGEYFLNIEWISNPQSPQKFHFVYMFSIRKLNWFLQCDS